MNCPFTLDQHLAAYLKIRAAVGLTNTKRYEQLRDFVAYAQSVAESETAPIRAATALAWAWDNAPASCGSLGRADRLMAVRSFLSYLTAIIPGTEVPGSRLVAGPRRQRPYIFSDDEVMALIEAAGRRSARVPFRPIVHSTLLGLLASTGLRIAEALRLRVIDVRLADDHPNLQILETKFQKSRIVPLHLTAAAVLDSYLDQRRTFRRGERCDRLLVNRDGRPLHIHTVGAWFTQLTRDLRIGTSGGEGRQPCLTSFRHTFAVRRLREWHKAGLDVQSLLPTLAVYLGHVGPEGSYWYLTATPDLLRAAGARFTPDVEGGVS